MLFPSWSLWSWGMNPLSYNPIAEIIWINAVGYNFLHFFNIFFQIQLMATSLVEKRSTSPLHGSPEVQVVQPKYNNRYINHFLSSWSSPNPGSSRPFYWSALWCSVPPDSPSEVCVASICSCGDKLRGAPGWETGYSYPFLAVPLNTAFLISPPY